MTISPTYPVVLQNGTTADASQVMANFYQIQTDVNSNAAHNGANSDITSLNGLTTPIPITEGGTGAATAAQALINLGVTAALAAIVAVPIGGTIVWNASGSIPTGFLEENGQAISRTTYATLFALIGTTFGPGDGSTTFNIPDSRGYFHRGWSDGSSVDSGRAFGSYQADGFQTHTHGTDDPEHYHLIPYVATGTGSGGGHFVQNNDFTNSTPTSSAATGITVTAPNSGNVGTETRPVNLARMNIIRVI